MAETSKLTIGVISAVVGIAASAITAGFFLGSLNQRVADLEKKALVPGTPGKQGPKGDPGKKGDKGDQGPPGHTAQFPSGTILISVNRCSALGSGWAEYEHGYGRMIVGAGKPTQKHYQTSSYPYWQPYHLPKTEQNRKKLEVYEVEASGGEERVVLENDQMPKHKHAISGIGNANNKGAHILGENLVLAPQGQGYSRGVIGTIGRGFTHFSDGDQPHNNMPPYIALYYCKKS